MGGTGIQVVLSYLRTVVARRQGRGARKDILSMTFAQTSVHSGSDTCHQSNHCAREVICKYLTVILRFYTQIQVNLFDTLRLNVLKEIFSSDEILHSSLNPFTAAIMVAYFM